MKKISLFLFASILLFGCGEEKSTGPDNDPGDSTSSTENTYGDFKDSRDGNSYRTLEIGGKTWMVDNLNFKAEGSVCFAEEEGNCEKYGRMYSFESAMTAAPEGWHVATDEDWKELERSINMGGEDIDKESIMRGQDVASDLIKDGSTGFDVVLAGTWGYTNGTVNWDNPGGIISYWTSTTAEKGVTKRKVALTRTFYGEDNLARQSENIKMISVDPLKFVRCVKN